MLIMTCISQMSYSFVTLFILNDIYAFIDSVEEHQIRFEKKKMQRPEERDLLLVVDPHLRKTRLMNWLTC